MQLGNRLSAIWRNRNKTTDWSYVGTGFLFAGVAEEMGDAEEKIVQRDGGLRFELSFVQTIGSAHLSLFLVIIVIKEITTFSFASSVLLSESGKPTVCLLSFW